MATNVSEQATRDYTKTGWYVVLDLMVKAITAFGLIVLGYAGWKLQHDVEATRAASDQRERAERKYLPELRSITEVDVALLEASKEFDWPTFSAEETVREARVGAHLSYLGESLYFPDAEPAAYLISAADNLSKENNPVEIEASTRTAVLFVAEFMRYAPLFRRWEANRDARVTVRGNNLLIVDSRQVALSINSLDPRTAKLWQQWLPRDGATPGQLFREVDLTVLTDPLDEQLVAVCDDILRRHSDLADKYVEIRSDVLKSRGSLVE